MTIGLSASTVAVVILDPRVRGITYSMDKMLRAFLALVMPEEIVQVNGNLWHYVFFFLGYGTDNRRDDNYNRRSDSYSQGYSGGGRSQGFDDSYSRPPQGNYNRQNMSMDNSRGFDDANRYFRTCMSSCVLIFSLLHKRFFFFFFFFFCRCKGPGHCCESCIWRRPCS